MDVAWGLCTCAASAVASSTHQSQGRGGNTAGRRSERGGRQGGGQRYKPDQPFFPSAHKYLCGSYINSRPEEEIKVKCMKLRLRPDTGCTSRSYLLNIKLHLTPVLARVAWVGGSEARYSSRCESVYREALQVKVWLARLKRWSKKTQPAPKPTCVLDRAT